MKKIKDLTPKLKTKLKTAEEEFVQEYSPDLPFGQSVGGLSAFAQVFKRGYGNDIFGVDSNGVWLGGSDYDRAIVRMGYDGSNLIFDLDEDKAKVHWGYQEGGY